MKFRHFDLVLSNDFEVVILLKAINFYLNETNKKGVNNDDVRALLDKIMFYSTVIEKDVSSPFSKDS